MARSPALGLGCGRPDAPGLHVPPATVAAATPTVRPTRVMRRQRTAVHRDRRAAELRGPVQRPRRAGRPLLLERARLGELECLPAHPAQGSADAAQAGRHRRHLQLPAPPGVLVRHGHVRHGVLPGVHQDLQGRQRQQHLRQRRSHGQGLHRPPPGDGVHGDAVLPARLGRMGRPATAATRPSGAPRSTSTASRRA